MRATILKKDGFSLVEVMIVVTIIGILATIALTQFQSYKEKSFNTSAMTDIQNLRTSLEAYYAENHRYP